MTIIPRGSERCTLCGEHVQGLLMRWFGYEHDIILCPSCASTIRREFSAELATMAALNRIRRRATEGDEGDELI